MAHNSDAKARRCASECLQLFCESPQEEHLHHRMTWEHLREGSPTRVQIEEYAAGKNLRDLPQLKMLVYELKFVPTAERAQEGDHSIVNKMVHDRKVSGPYVSRALRLPEIRNMMRKEAEYLAFLNCFSDVEDLDVLAKRFGFYKHEQWQLACPENRSRKQKNSLAAMILYSMDVETQFAKMQAVKKVREKRQRERKAKEDQWKQHFQSKRIFSVQTVEEVAMSDHMQSELQVGRLYSLPAGSAAVRSLPQSLQPVHLQPQSAKPLPLPASLDAKQEQLLALTPDVEQGYPSSRHVVETPTRHEEDSDPAFAERAMFWRLTCARPSRHKLVRLPAASAQKLSQDSLCVTLHRSFQGGDKCYVEIEPARTEGVQVPVAVLSVFQTDIQAMRDGMLAWSTVKELAFTLAGCEHAMSEAMMKILTRMVVAEAFPRSGSHLGDSGGHCTVQSWDHEALTCLEALKNMGMVELLPEVDGFDAERMYVFTRLGVQSLRHVHQCTAPARFFRTVGELADIPHAEWPYCSNWELFKLLQHEGWQLRRAPPPKIIKRNPLPAHTSAALRGHLLWYLPGESLQSRRPYMLALLQSKTLFESLALAELHHCQPVKYYEKVLDGRSDGTLELRPIQDSEDEAPKLSLDVSEDPAPGAIRDVAVRPARPRRAGAGSSAGELQHAAPEPAQQVDELMQLFEELSPAEHTSDTGNERAFMLESPSGSEHELPSSAPSAAPALKPSERGADAGKSEAVDVAAAPAGGPAADGPAVGSLAESDSVAGNPAVDQPAASPAAEAASASASNPDGAAHR